MIIVFIIFIFILAMFLAARFTNNANMGSSAGQTDGTEQKADERVYYKLARDLYNHPNEDERQAICMQYTKAEVDSAKVVLKQMEESDDYRKLIFHLTDTVESGDDNPIKNI